MVLNKKEVVSRIAKTLRERNIRKPVSMPKHAFYVSDDEGHKTKFMMRQVNKTVMYNEDDVDAILNIFLQFVEDAMKVGDTVSLHGFGMFAPRYHKERKLHNVANGEVTMMRGAYVPKFICGKNLKRAALLYTESLSDKELVKPQPVYPDDEEV